MKDFKNTIKKLELVIHDLTNGLEKEKDEERVIFIKRAISETKKPIRTLKFIDKYIDLYDDSVYYKK